MKTFTTSILMFIATIGFAQDTTRVDYINLFKLDTTNNKVIYEEVFGMLLKEHYAPLGEWNMMMTERFDGGEYWNIKTVCFRFVAPYPHWECYTPAELEVKLKN